MTAIAILGMGGLGKTTLVSNVYLAEEADDDLAELVDRSMLQMAKLNLVDQLELAVFQLLKGHGSRRTYKPYDQLKQTTSFYNDWEI